MTAPRIIRRVIVSGRVQGVGFRAWVEHEARLRDLSGWVRNRRDGTVEAVFAGKVASVEEMIAACHQGPASARVTSVVAREGGQADIDPSHRGDFVCLPTL